MDTLSAGLLLMPFKELTKSESPSTVHQENTYNAYFLISLTLNLTIHLVWLFRVLCFWGNIIVRVWLSEELTEKVLCPDNAVDGLGGGVADGAAGEGLGGGGRCALVTLAQPLKEGESHRVPEYSGLPHIRTMECMQSTLTLRITETWPW